MNRNLQEQFVNEMQVIQTVSHPHIMATNSLYHDQNNFYIESELCEGGDLLDRLESVGTLAES